MRVAATDSRKVAAALNEVRAMYQELEDLKQQLHSGDLVASDNHGLEVEQQQQLLLLQAQGVVHVGSEALDGIEAQPLGGEGTAGISDPEDGVGQSVVGGDGDVAEGSCLPGEQQQQHMEQSDAGEGEVQQPSSGSGAERASLHVERVEAWENYLRAYPEQCTPDKLGNTDARSTAAAAETGAKTKGQGGRGSQCTQEITPAAEGNDVQGASSSGASAPAPAAFAPLGTGYSKADADQLCTRVSMVQRITQIEARLAELIEHSYDPSSPRSNTSGGSSFSSSFTGLSAAPSAAAPASFGTPRKSRFASAGDAPPALGIGCVQGEAADAVMEQQGKDPAADSTARKSPVPPLDLHAVHTTADPGLGEGIAALSGTQGPSTAAAVEGSLLQHGSDSLPAATGMTEPSTAGLLGTPAAAGPATPGSIKSNSFLSRIRMNWASPKGSPGSRKGIGKSASSSGSALSRGGSGARLGAAVSVPASLSRGSGGSSVSFNEPGLGAVLAAAATDAEHAAGTTAAAMLQQGDSSARSASNSSRLARDSRGESEVEAPTVGASVRTPAPGSTGDNGGGGKLGVFGSLLKRPGHASGPQLPEQQQHSAPAAQARHRNAGGSSDQGTVAAAAVEAAGACTWPSSYSQDVTKSQELQVKAVLRETVTVQNLKDFLRNKSLGGKPWKLRKKHKAEMLQDVLAWHKCTQQQGQQGAGLAQHKQPRVKPELVVKCVKTEVEHLTGEIIVTDGSSSTSSSSHSSSRVRELGSNSSIGDGGMIMKHSSSSQQHGEHAALDCGTIDLIGESDGSEELAQAVSHPLQASAAVAEDDMRGSGDSSSSWAGNRRSTLDSLAGWGVETPPLKLQHGALEVESDKVYQARERLVQQGQQNKVFGAGGAGINSAQYQYRLKVLQGQVQAERKRR